MMEHAHVTRCPYPDGKCFDGNGKYQYKGRGHQREDVEILLNRIDWLAKHSEDNPLYTSSYIIAYALSLAVVFLFYAFSTYCVSPWEYLLVILSAFIITFSISNLFNFHTDRYPTYYVRQNIQYILNQLDLNKKTPGNPKKNKLPHRTKMQDTLKN